MFLVVCAWCAKENLLNVLDCDPHGKDAISHGICPRHLEELKAEVLQLDSIVPAKQHSPAIAA